MKPSLKNMIHQVHQLNEQIGGQWNSEWQLLWIVEEVGEISRALQKLESLPGKLHDTPSEELQINLKEEIGDVIYGLLGVCKSVDIEFSDALAYSLEKFKMRHSE